MKRLLVLVIVVFGSVFTTAAQGTGEWIRYESPEGRYSVLVPKKPEISQQDTTAATGEKLPQYLASSADGNGVFMIGYFDYAADMTFSLDKARDGMLSSMEATLLGEESISLGGSPGRALRLLAKSTDGREFLDRATFYDVARRIYVLQCIFPKDEDGAALNEKCNKFADSFKARTP